MNLEQPTEQNMKVILEKIADQLGVVNRTLMDPEDYDLEKYDELKLMYDMIVSKGSLSASETQAFIEELRAVRK